MNVASDKLETKLNKSRKFLIVDPNNRAAEDLANRVNEHLTKVNFVYAPSFSGASQKIENDPPDVIIIGTKEIDEQTKKFVKQTSEELKSKFGIIIITELPDKEHFVDQVVQGKIQLLHKPDDDQILSGCITRIMNYLNTEENSKFSLKFLAPNDILIEQGDKSDTVYILLRGTLRAVKKDDGPGLEQILGEIKAGEFVGEMAYINNETRSAKVIADSDCELIEIPSENLDHVLFSKPAWSKALMLTLSKRLKSANQKP